MQPLFLKPGAEAEQSIRIELFQLIQQDKTAFRIDRPYDGRGGDQLIRSAHAVPFLAVVGELAVLHAQTGEGELCGIQQCILVVTDLFKLIGQILILLGVVGGVLLGLLAIAVGADLNVDLLDLLQAALDLLGALVLQIQRVLL